MIEFDQEHADVLRGLWFLGDVHGEFKYLSQALLAAEKKPSWIVFLGDVDIDHRPFREILEPLRRNFPKTQVAFIYGNHDADTYEHWEMLHDCGDAVALHGRVVDLNGIRVAGLGGNFLGRIWSPPGEALFRNKQAAMNRGSYQWRDGQRPHPQHHAAIYPDDLENLAKLRADILVTHEAPSCHKYGFDAIDNLSRDMFAVRTFHGHHHDDPSDHYATLREDFGFDPRAVAFCAIKNGLGEVVFEGFVAEKQVEDSQW
jgi:predicted MPP superfamily phosphohydrolase